jgi:hypothetical protein
VEDGSDDQCRPEDRAEVLQFSLAALHYPLPEQPLLTAVKYDADFEFGRSCRDAVWTLAFALNRTIIEGIPIVYHANRSSISFVSHKIQAETLL